VNTSSQSHYCRPLPQAAIDSYAGHGAFARLTWSAPTDAAWVSADGTLRCHSAAQVLLLLKSSDKVAGDLCAAERGYPPPPPPCGHHHYLMLRKFRNINPALEFRCFVRDRVLVALSQRRWVIGRQSMCACGEVY
jgi:hypothetical protein